jgi:transcriptional regulator with XRE-family HTH domain
VVFREFAVLHKNGVSFLSYLSEKIKEFQEKKGIRSVRAIATESGVPVSTLYDVLKERTNNLSVDNSQKLADYMGITVDELYGKEKTPDTNVSEVDLRIANVIKVMTDEQKELFLNLAEQLIQQ